MKKILATLLAACMVLSMLVVVPFTASAAATGATESTVGYKESAVVSVDTTGLNNLANVSALEDDAYIINSAAGFTSLRAFVTADANAFDGKTVYLTANVDFTAASTADKFAQIANFTGTFDGQGYSVKWNVANNSLFAALTPNIGDITIKNLKIEGNNSGVALRAYANANGAVNFENIYNAGSGSSFDMNEGNFGGIVRIVESGTVNISNCTNCASPNTAVSGKNNWGGFVGSSSGTLIIKNCINLGNLTSNENVGGFVGINQTNKTITIENCINSGTIAGTKYVGGIVGISHGSVTVKNTENTGSVTASGTCSGGIVGETRNSLTIENCINSRTIAGTECIGGFVGNSTGTLTIENCINSGTVAGTKYVGGIVGIPQGIATVKNTENTGNVTASTQRSGGIVGDTRNSLTIENCVNRGAISTTDDAGGILGMVASGTSHTVEVDNCVNYGKVTSRNGGAGGIVGRGWGPATVSNCDNYGTIETGYGANVGGIVGAFTAGSAITLTITTCNNYTPNIIAVHASANGILGYNIAPTLLTVNETNCNDYADKAQWVGYQTREFEGAKELRLVGSIDSLEYNSVGFQITVSYDAGEGVVTKVLDKALTNAYNSLLADGAPITAPTSYRGENAKLFALVIEGLEAGVEYTFTVQTYSVATQGADAVMGEAATFKVTL